MICKACKTIPVAGENEDCFEKALDVVRKHYMFYKNALQQRDTELQQVKERNEKLNKALKLLQSNQHATKRFKTQNSEDSWLGNGSSQEERFTSEHSLTDDEQMGANNLNIALNSEQLFETSLSQTNDVSRSLTEMVHSPRLKESPKRNKQHDLKRCLKDRNFTSLERTKSDWHTKERNSPVGKSWALKFVQPTSNEKKIVDVAEKPADKKLSLTLKKTNPSKMKQSLIHFNKSKETGFKESDVDEDMIDASPVVDKKNLKAARSWSHRNVQNCNNLTNETVKKDVDSTKILDDIVFDFSPTKKADALHCSPPSENQELKRHKPQSLKFNNDNSSDCTSLPNDVNLGVPTNTSDSSSVVVLTPRTEDIIFVEDDSCNVEPEIDTMDLLADNLDKLKKYESKCILKQPQSKGLETFKIPTTSAKQMEIKQEKVTQENTKDVKKADAEKPGCSKDGISIKTTKHHNPLLSSDEMDTEDDEDFMPKPFVIKQETENAKVAKKLSIKQRFNIDCENCEKLIEFLDEKLTDAEIQQHLDKCKRHNNPNFMRQNTPADFWNPFILSFQADDPRNEVLIDKRFKESKQ